MSTPQQANRIDAAIKARARDLRKTLDQVAEEAGITKQTLRAIRRGENRPFYKTAHGIEDALRVERGSLYGLLDGGDLRPLPEQEPEPAPTPLLIDPYEAQIMELTELDLETRQAIIAEMRADKAAAVDRAREKARSAKDRKGRNSA